MYVKKNRIPWLKGAILLTFFFIVYCTFHRVNLARHYW